MYRNISKTVYKVSDFLSWQRSNSLILSPSFQRRAVWPDAAKSLLIDTVVQGLPIPIIFLREKVDLNTLEPIREVVDGQQRLRTIITFVEPSILRDFNPDRDPFVVKKTHNTQIAGKDFRQLDPTTKKKILNYDFSVHILSSDTDDREVLQIFARMNSTGVKLNDQELRNAQFYGIFKTRCYNLAYEQLNRWREWDIFSEMDIARMLEVEETSDLIVMMLKGIQGKSQPALNKTYSSFEETFPFEEEITRRFRIIMEKINDTFGTQIKTSIFYRKVLFHTLFTLYYDLLFGLKSEISKVTPKHLPTNLRTALLEASHILTHADLPEELSKVLRGATGNLESRTERFSFVKRALESA